MSASSAIAGPIRPAPWPIILAAAGAFMLLVLGCLAVFGPGEAALT